MPNVDLSPFFKSLDVSELRAKLPSGQLKIVEAAIKLDDTRNGSITTVLAALSFLKHIGLEPDAQSVGRSSPSSRPAPARSQIPPVIDSIVVLKAADRETYDDWIGQTLKRHREEVSASVSYDELRLSELTLESAKMAPLFIPISVNAEGSSAFQIYPALLGKQFVHLPHWGLAFEASVRDDELSIHLVHPFSHGSPQDRFFQERFNELASSLLSSLIKQRGHQHHLKNLIVVSELGVSFIHPIEEKVPASSAAAAHGLKGVAVSDEDPADSRNVRRTLAGSPESLDMSTDSVDEKNQAFESLQSVLRGLKDIVDRMQQASPGEGADFGNTEMALLGLRAMRRRLPERNDKTTIEPFLTELEAFARKDLVDAISNASAQAQQGIKDADHPVIAAFKTLEESVSIHDRAQVRRLIENDGVFKPFQKEFLTLLENCEVVHTAKSAWMTLADFQMYQAVMGDGAAKRSDSNEPDMKLAPSAYYLLRSKGMDALTVAQQVHIHGLVKPSEKIEDHHIRKMWKGHLSPLLGVEFKEPDSNVSLSPLAAAVADGRPALTSAGLEEELERLVQVFERMPHRDYINAGFTFVDGLIDERLVARYVEDRYRAVNVGFPFGSLSPEQEDGLIAYLVKEVLTPNSVETLIGVPSPSLPNQVSSSQAEALHRAYHEAQQRKGICFSLLQPRELKDVEKAAAVFSIHRDYLSDLLHQAELAFKAKGKDAELHEVFHALEDIQVMLERKILPHADKLGLVNDFVNIAMDQVGHGARSHEALWILPRLKMVAQKVEGRLPPGSPLLEIPQGMAIGAGEAKASMVVSKDGSSVSETASPSNEPPKAFAGGSISGLQRFRGAWGFNSLWTGAAEKTSSPVTPSAPSSIIHVRHRLAALGFDRLQSEMIIRKARGQGSHAWKELVNTVSHNRGHASVRRLVATGSAPVTFARFPSFGFTSARGVFSPMAMRVIR